MQGNAGLARQLSDGRSPEYETVYLGWDELTAQLQEIVDTELGVGCTVTLRRQDYYYWDMRLQKWLGITIHLSRSKRPSSVSASINPNSQCYRRDVQGIY